MKLFLDACIIIYWAEMKEPFYSKFIDALENINRLHPNEGLAVSRLSVLECCVQPLKLNDKKILKIYHEFFSNSSIEIVEPSPHIIEIATQLKASFPLKTPDAIQAACALSLENKVRFVTNDKSFKQITKLHVDLI